MIEEDMIYLNSGLIHKMARKFGNAYAISKDRSVEYCDVVQEAAIAFLKTIRTYDGTTKLSTYYHTVASNYFFDILRKMSARAKGTSKDMDTPELVPLELAHNIPAIDLIGGYELRSSVAAIMQRTLPESDRIVLELYFGMGCEDGMGMPQDEISEKLGMSQQAVSYSVNKSIRNPRFIKELSKIRDGG